ncbi:MAG: transposase [Oligoflexia bacterium]|nr:transposase [Oligoflexia bacterium]
MQIPIKSPEKNGRVERFHLSLKREAFTNVVSINLLQTIKICREYQQYYNNHRPHQGLNGKIPYENQHPSNKNIVSFTKMNHLGGKIISFEPKKHLVA